MLGQVVRHQGGVALLHFQPVGQGWQAVDADVPGRIGRDAPPEVLAVQQEIRLRAARPNDHAPHVGAETPDVLGEAVHHKINAVGERALAEGRSEGVIHNADHALVGGAGGVHLSHHAGHHLQVNQLHGGVGRGLEVDHTGFRADSGAEGVLALEVGQRVRDAKAGQPVDHVTIGAAIDGRRHDDVVALAHVDANGGGDGGHARGKDDGGFAPLGKGQVLFQHAAAGLIQALIDVDGGGSVAVDVGVGELLEPGGAPLRAAQAERDGGGDRGRDVVLEIPLFTPELAVDQNGTIAIAGLLRHLLTITTGVRFVKSR